IPMNSEVERRFCSCSGRVNATRRRYDSAARLPLARRHVISCQAMSLLKKGVSAMSEPVRIFVSHAQEDHEFAMRLVEDLRRVLKNEDAVWCDASGGVQGGVEWWSTIVAELTARPVFLMVSSPAALASRSVLAELDLALQQQRSPAGKLIIRAMVK